MNRQKRSYKNINQSDIQWQAYTEVRNTYYHAIREAKQQFWNKFLAEAQGKDIF